MIILKIQKTWLAHREWIATTLLERLGVEIVIQIGEEKGWVLSVADHPGSINLPDIYFTSLPPEGVCHGKNPADKISWCDFFTGAFKAKLPVLFGEISSSWGGAIPVGSDIRLDVDIFGSAYWSMSRIEELLHGQRDEHDRFSAFQSHAWNNNYLDIPYIDEYINLLKEIIIQIWPELPISKCETFKQFISHDVDDPYLYRYMRSAKAMTLIAANAIKSKNPLLGLKWTAGLGLDKMGLRFDDPCDTFDWLMDQSEDVGVKSSFYFIASDRNCPLDADYDICDPAIISLLKKIAQRGHEIGIHPGYESHKRPEVLMDQLSRLKVALSSAGVEEQSLGGRMHFLRWDSRTTPKALAHARLKYDSTLGFADYPGFRCGTCHPFAYFDPVEGVATKLILRPLIIMESTIIARRYMNLGVTEKAFEVFRNLKHRCSRVGGEFSLLWHNSSLFGHAERELYQEIIKA